jgi:hypothetical protein
MLNKFDRKQSRKCANYFNTTADAMKTIYILCVFTGVSFANKSTPYCCAQGIFRQIEKAAKRAGGDIAREAKKAGGDIAREGKKAGGDLSREGKKAIDDAGKLAEKPFRHLSETAKESLFIGMRNHVIGKNNELGVRGTRFTRDSKYYQFIQPYLPDDMDFSDITFFFSAYVPSDMAGITFENYVYINWPFREFDPNYLDLLAHETGHVIQYKRWGLKGFARSYIDDSFNSFFKEPSFDQVKIHDNLMIEQEATDFAFRVMTAYEQKLNSPQYKPRQSNMPALARNPPDQNLLQPQNIPIAQNQEIIPGRQDANNNQPANNILREIESALLSANQPRLGIRFEIIPGRGALVTSIIPGMLASNAGLEINDIVVSIDGTPVQTDNSIPVLLRRAAASGRRQATVIVENHRLKHLPINQRMQEIVVNW